MSNEQSAHVDWYWGHWHFDYSVSDSEGLSLLNGSYRGMSVIGKFSLPVIRVKYLVDGGLLDWRRVFGLGAGPYADQLRWNLGGDHGLQKISGRGNNDYVLLYEYKSGDTRWIEIGIYARIGAYHIYQAWHLSEHGTVLPQVWSKGLTINMDHSHHPYWRLDFDMDGAAHNRVSVIDDGKWFYYPNEANDVKNESTGRVWYVRNLQNGRGAWIYPGSGDGQPDGFSGLDVAVRLFQSSEEDNPWPFGVNEIGFDNGEAVGDNDVVFWYVAHLFHHAAEGGDAWHGAGPTIQVDLTKLPPIQRPPPDFGITLHKQKNQLGGDLIVQGEGFTPGGRAEIVIENVPNRTEPYRGAATVDPSGKFSWSETFRCTSSNVDDAFTDVTVSAIDGATENVATQTTQATIWVCTVL